MQRMTLFLILIWFASAAFAKPEKLFYMSTNAQDSSFPESQLQQLKQHVNAIDVVAPQIYALDAEGNIFGKIDAKLLQAIKENHLKIIPLIINIDFNQELFHQFLHNTIAQEKAIAKMLLLCEQNHFDGLQFDFENISIKDKDAYTHFVELASKRLHQNHLSLSVAVVPRTSDLFSNDYARWYYENWSGAYDYRALSQFADFVSLMSYDQHTSLTTPGPIAAIDWVEKTLQYALQFVPAKKLSLGVPTYSGYWAVGKLGADKIPEKYIYRSKETQLSYTQIQKIVQQFHLKLIWQNEWQSHYVMFMPHEKNVYLFVEDTKSFQAKLKLMKRYQLRGISVWKFGLEDAAIWNNQNLF